MLDDKSSTSNSSSNSSSDSSSNSSSNSSSTAKAPANADYYQYLLEILKQESSEEAAKIRNLMMKRIATEGTVIESRIPAPKNITEIGGYLNLLASIGEDEMRRKAIAAALGLPHFSIPDNI